MHPSTIIQHTYCKTIAFLEPTRYFSWINQNTTAATLYQPAGCDSGYSSNTLLLHRLSLSLQLASCHPNHPTNTLFLLRTLFALSCTLTEPRVTFTNKVAFEYLASIPSFPKLSREGYSINPLFTPQRSEQG